MNAAYFFRSTRGLMAAAACVVLLHALPGDQLAFGQSAARVVRVEEDWELLINTSDANSVAPQVTCVFSPLSDLDSVYGCVELNQRSLPVFRGGGVQVQAWDGDTALAFQDWADVSVFSTNLETVCWTQAMALGDDGQLTFEVLNGTSRTWGAFGYPTAMSTSVATSLDSLNGYTPTVTVANSGISYAANRVRSLVLKRVRYTTDDGNVYEDGSERAVLLAN
jgi:hypothetical protein